MVALTNKLRLFKEDGDSNLCPPSIEKCRQRSQSLISYTLSIFLLVSSSSSHSYDSLDSYFNVDS